MMRYLLLLTLAISAYGQHPLYDFDRAGFDRHLAALGSKGLAKLVFELIPAGEPAPNAFGEYAFGYGGQPHTDLALPNPAFFQHLDWVVKRAASRGIQVAIAPASAEAKVIVLSSAEKATDFGRYLGRRYVRSKNLHWTATKGSPMLAAIEDGIRQFDSID